MHIYWNKLNTHTTPTTLHTLVRFNVTCSSVFFSLNVKCLGVLTQSHPYTAPAHYNVRFQHIVVVCCWNILLPQFMLVHYWKANEVRRCEQKNIQNKAVKIKFNLYINKYIKKETLQNITNILIYSVNISLCVYACVCVCVCVCATNTHIIEKD